MRVFPVRAAVIAVAIAAFGSAAALADDMMMDGKPSPYNDVPYAKIKAMPPADRMATVKKAMSSGTLLMPGMNLKSSTSKEVALTGEIVDTNCGSTGLHGKNHAMCARICVLQGSTMLFLTKDRSAAYPISSAAAATPVSEDVYNAVGDQDIQIVGFVNEHGGGVPVLTIEKINGTAVKQPENMMMHPSGDKM
jgi:hypothetical protein